MPSDTYRFLGAAIRGDREELIRLAQKPDWNWAEVFSVASDEGTLPALSAYSSAFEGSASGEDVAQFLSEVAAANLERNRTIAEETKHAARLLNGAGLEPVLLKGAAYLADGVYPDPAWRYTGDIDLLIPEEQIPAAAAVLRENGYVKEDLDPFGEYRHHYPPLSRPGLPSVELHGSLGLGACGRLLPASDLTGQSRRRDWDGAFVRIPRPEHLLTHLVAHSQMLHSYTERIWTPLRAVSDLYALEKRYGSGLDWSAAGKHFRERGQYGLLALFIRQAALAAGTAPVAELPWSAALRLRWLRRRLLHRLPFLRYADPVYMLSTLLGRRLLTLHKLLKTRGGLRYLSARIFEPRVYSRLWTDLLEGRGR